jgi:peptidyl-prolyl cis-trans isomerase SurA
MVCERTEVAKGLPTRQQILQQLEDEQFDLVSRGYLRDLRRTAFIDIRL